MEPASPEKKGSALSLPVAIVLAGAFIAGAIFVSNADLSAKPGVPSDVFAGSASLKDTIRPVTADDWIKGDPAAPVTLIEYSDLQCPYCASLNPTIERIISEFPQVRWVYRHLPLTSIHPQALPAAIAAECVGKLAGDGAFFAFNKALFGSQRALGPALYEREAGALGVPLQSFKSCLKDSHDRIDVDTGEAIAAGANGTPFSVVVSEDGRYLPVNGSLDYAQVRAIVKAALPR